MRHARRLGAGNLILSHFSLLGLEDFDVRVQAAAAAGFDGIGLYLGEYGRLRESGVSDADLEATLSAADLCLAEIEVLTEWCPLTHRGSEMLNTACHLGERFAARHVAVNGPFTGDVRDAAAAFARLCDACAEVGLRVSLEHLPFNNVDTLATCQAIVDAADRDNGGVCLDSWHHFRGEADWHRLEQLPPERITSVQINDGARVPENADYLADTIANRRVPGDGEFDLRRFVDTIRGRGWQGPLSVEVLSSELRSQPPERVCRRLFQATRALEAPAGGSSADPAPR